MKQYLALMAGALLAVVGCSKETGPSGAAGGAAIRFEMASTGVQTRARNEVSTDALLRNKSVGVFASYTGKLTYENTTVSPDFMYNQEVKYTSNNVWEYDPVKYWPNDPAEYVSFFAYAPYEASPGEGSVSGIIGMSRQVDLGDPWINFRLPAFEDQVDLLYGQRQTAVSDGYVYTPWLDQQKMNWGEGPMKFVFMHALACVGETITIKMADALYEAMHGEVDITIDSVNVTYRNLTTKARLVLRSAGDPNWKEIISGELTTSRAYHSGALSGKTFSKSAATNPAAMTLTSGGGLFYIPLQVAGTPSPAMDIDVYYTVTHSVTSGTATFHDVASTALPFNLQNAGTRQGLALTLGAGFNLQADVVTGTWGISMPGTVSPTQDDVTVNHP